MAHAASPTLHYVAGARGVDDDWRAANCIPLELTIEHSSMYHHGTFAGSKNNDWQKGIVVELQPAWRLVPNRQPAWMLVPNRSKTQELPWVEHPPQHSLPGCTICLILCLWSVA